MWVSKNHPYAIVYLYMACLYGYAVIESFGYDSPIEELKVNELSVNEVRITFKVNITQFTIQDQVRLGQKLTFKAFGVRDALTFSRHKGRPLPGAFLFEQYYPLLLRGSVYNVVLKVTLEDNVWEKRIIYKAAPLPHLEFEVSKEGNKIVFRYTPQAATNRGIESRYAFTKVTCRNFHTSINEEREIWTHNYTEPSGTKTLVRREAVINEDLYGVFKNGGSVSCTASTVSTRGAYLESPQRYASYVIAPTSPEFEFGSEGSIRSGKTTQVTFGIKVNLVTSTFSRIQVKVQSNLYCTLERVEFSNDTVTCTAQFPSAGTLYQLVTEIWSNGPIGERKSVQSNGTDLILKPRPPRSMNASIIDGEVIVSLDVESIDTNKFNTIYLNRSDNPLFIRELNSSDQLTRISWGRSLSPGRFTFNCWAGVKINQNTYTSKMISAYYTIAPSPPFGLTLTNDSGNSISFTWQIRREEQPEEFTLTVCEVVDPDICLERSLLNNQSGEINLQIVQELDEGKNYRAWVKAIAYGLTSNRSNEVLIHVRVTPKQTTEQEATNPVGKEKLIIWSIIGSIVGVAVLVIGMAVALVWYRQPKRRRQANKVASLDHTAQASY